MHDHLLKFRVKKDFFPDIFFILFVKYSKNKNVHIISLFSHGYCNFGSINASQSFINYSFQQCGDNWTHVVYLSGDSYPLKNASDIRKLLINNEEKNFIEIKYYKPIAQRVYKKRPKNMENFLELEDIYSGPAFWALTRNFSFYLLNDNYSKEIIEYNKNAPCPEESAYQTIIKNSKYNSSYLNIILMRTKWNGRSPHALCVGDEKFSIEDILKNKNDSFFVRKVHNIKIAMTFKQRLNLVSYSELSIKSNNIIFFVTLCFLILFNPM